MSVAEWVKAEEGLFFVSDRHSVDQLVDDLEFAFDLSEEQADWLRSASSQAGVRAAFAQLNASLAPAKQAQNLGSDSAPGRGGCLLLARRGWIPDEEGGLTNGRAAL